MCVGKEEKREGDQSLIRFFLCSCKVAGGRSVPLTSVSPAEYLIVENNPNTENPCCYFVTPCTKKLLYSTTGSSLPSLPSPPSFIFFLNFLPSLPFSPSLLFIHLASLLVLSVCQTLLSFSLSNRKRHLPLKKHPSVKYLSLACSSGQQLLLEPTSYLDKPGNS